MVDDIQQPLADGKTGNLWFIPKVGEARIIQEKQSFPILASTKKRLIKEPAYEPAKGKFKSCYTWTNLNN